MYLNVAFTPKDSGERLIYFQRAHSTSRLNVAFSSPEDREGQMNEQHVYTILCLRSSVNSCFMHHFSCTEVKPNVSLV